MPSRSASPARTAASNPGMPVVARRADRAGRRAEARCCASRLPLGMSLQPGTRVIVDQGQPMTGPYVICFTNGCMADYEASGDTDRQAEEGAGARRAGHQRRRPADQPACCRSPISPRPMTARRPIRRCSRSSRRSCRTSCRSGPKRRARSSRASSRRQPRDADNGSRQIGKNRGAPSGAPLCVVSIQRVGQRLS